MAREGVAGPTRDGPKVLFSTYADQWLKHQHHFRGATVSNTATRLETMVKPKFEGVYVHQITRALISEAVAEWAEEYAASTIKGAYSHLTSILKTAKLDGLIESVPASVKLPRVIRERVVPLTDAQVSALMESMPASMRPLVVVAAATGLRPSELAGLTWSRINGSVLTIDRQIAGTSDGEPVFGPPKTPSSNRKVGIGASVKKALDEQREMFGVGPARTVWRSARGRLLTRKALSEMWVARRRLIGGKVGDGWHQLRHYHASKLIASGMSPVAVAARLGHRDATETLETSAHLWPDDDARMVAVSEGVARALIGSQAPMGPDCGSELDSG